MGILSLQYIYTPCFQRVVFGMAQRQLAKESSNVVGSVIVKWCKCVPALFPVEICGHEHVVITTCLY